MTENVISRMITSMTVLSSARGVRLLVLRDGAAIRRVPYALARRFDQICTAACAEAVEAADLTPLEFAVMAYTNPADGEPDLDQSSLASRLGVDRNTTSLLVTSLEHKGLVARRPSATDRRTRLIRLTPKGERLFFELHPRGLELQQSILETLDPSEREHFLDLLVRVIEANPERARPGTGRRKRGTTRTTNT